MKQVFKIILIAALITALTLSCISLLGCSEKKSDGEIKVLCTIFPIYDWTRNIVGEAENLQVSLLIKNGADPHSFQPSFADMAAIKESDVVIYTGGASDTWVETAIEGDTVAIKLSELEGMNLYDVSHDSISHKEEEHEAHNGFDEHIWLSVNNAAVACDSICKTLGELDGDNSELYIENTSEYKTSLSELDNRMKNVASSIDEVLIFADRFPFVYLLEDYGIDYFAAFEGCTTDTSADFDTVIELAEQLAKSDCGYIFTTESANKELTSSVIRESKTEARVAVLDSMQSFGAADIDSQDYIEITERNISVLEEIFIK